MMNKLKVAFIGAGSRSFAGRTLVDLLLSEPLRAFDLELVLMDVIADHITRTEAFCRRAAAQLGYPVTIRTTTVLDEAVAGADFVVTAFEVNRNAAALWFGAGLWRKWWAGGHLSCPAQHGTDPPGGGGDGTALPQRLVDQFFQPGE
jgi:hypothetical protein